MNYHKLAIIILLFLISSLSFAQQITIIPEGHLQKGDTAEVTGDFVRIRTGPSLEHRIITMVNRGTKAVIYERGEKQVKIEGKENYWYRIKVTETQIEGWMFGAYLKKITISPDTQPEKIPLSNLQPTQENAAIQIEKTIQKYGGEVILEEIGSIPDKALQITCGDLNQNGVPEIIVLKKDKKGRYNLLTGYEPDNKSFKEVYSVKLHITRIEKIKIFEESFLEHPIIAFSTERITYVMKYDPEKNILRTMGKVNAPGLALGYQENGTYFFVYPKKNKIRDNDETITYYLQIETVEITRSRISFRNRIQYQKPLPVKKILTMDIDGDMKSDIITEIGGRDSGGGIAVLSFNGKEITRVHNTGFDTYNQNQFIEMWALYDKEKPLLVLYSTDPFNSNDVNTSFGFVYTTFQNKKLTFLDFYSVNKMLDDKNNYRKVIHYPWDENTPPFIILDFDQDSSVYRVYRVFFSRKSI